MVARWSCQAWGPKTGFWEPAPDVALSGCWCSVYRQIGLIRSARPTGFEPVTSGFSTRRSWLPGPGGAGARPVDARASRASEAPAPALLPRGREARSKPRDDVGRALSQARVRDDCRCRRCGADRLRRWSPFRVAVARAREAVGHVGLGVCGEHGGDPDSIEFFDQVGLEYVSCSPYRMPIARVAAAQAAIRSAGSSHPT